MNEITEQPELTPKGRQDLATAKELLDRADARELYVLFEKVQRENSQLVDSVVRVVGHYSGSANHPRYEPPSNAIESMERVALAAIQLAHDVIKGSK